MSDLQAQEQRLKDEIRAVTEKCQDARPERLHKELHAVRRLRLDLENDGQRSVKLQECKKKLVLQRDTLLALREQLGVAQELVEKLSTDIKESEVTINDIVKEVQALENQSG